MRDRASLTNDDGGADEEARRTTVGEYEPHVEARGCTLDPIGAIGSPRLLVCSVGQTLDGQRVCEFGSHA